MQFRIGINLGDVIEEGEKIYGDGVNIAARLEALADLGGICISKTAFDHIESRLPLGYQFLGRQTVKNIAKPSNLVARQVCEDIIALDLKWELPYCLIGWTHWMHARMGWSDSPEEAVGKAFQYVEKSTSLNESALAHGLLSLLYLITGVHENAPLEGERSIALAPNSADAHALYAFSLAFLGEAEKAISSIEYALRLNPFPPSWYFVILGVACRVLGRYVEAIASHKKAISIAPANLISHVVLTTAYALDGREREAHAEAEEISG